MQAYIPAGVFSDQKQHSAIAHLKAALAYYRRLGIIVKRVMTDLPACLPRQADARAYLTSKQRALDLSLWTHRYNWHRPHSGIKQQTPVGQLNLNQNNLLRLHIYHLGGCSRRRSTTYIPVGGPSPEWRWRLDSDCPQTATDPLRPPVPGATGETMIQSDVMDTALP